MFEQDPGKAGKDQATDWSLGDASVREARLPEQQGPGMYSDKVSSLGLLLSPILSEIGWI